MKKRAYRKSGLKPGDKVVIVNCFEADKYTGRIWEVETNPWDLCGSEVVLLKGHSGGFDTARLKKVTA
jgi:hypothetical protein